MRVYQYIEALHALPKNNPIIGFETSVDITSFLSEQWAGLFQRFLQQQQRMAEVHVIEELNGITKTMRDLTGYLIEEKKTGNEAIHTILLANHPLFSRIASLTKTGYRVYFTDFEEMAKWLKARNWEQADPDTFYENSIDEWLSDKFGYLVFRYNFFDENGRLKIIMESDWDDNWLELVNPLQQDKGDDIPF